MSSNEEDYNEGENPLVHGSKKRRIQRACDICRRKKIRCDGVQMPGYKCSNCTAYNLDCTYVETAKKRGPSKGYVEGLENRVEKMDKLLRRLCPDEAAYKSLLDALEKDDRVLEHEPLNPSTMASGRKEDTSPTLLATLSSSIRGQFITAAANEDDYDVGIHVTDGFKSMSLEARESPFFGKSSGAMLIREVMEAKRDYTGPNKWHPFISFRNIRPEFWGSPQWGIQREPLKPFDFPPLDLAEELINNYFIHANLHLPLLHRPTFEEEVKRNFHHSHSGFASVYLLVCGIGARYSTDPRVLVDGQQSRHSAGWKWFQQAVKVHNPLMTSATLYDVQSYALSAQFLTTWSTPNTCWTLIGVGIRLAQDVGAHRRRQGKRSTAQEELWKRAFWVLLVLDRVFSTALGRPLAIHEEDFDVSLPIDCDDEYWDLDDPAAEFKQPEGKPSKIAAFILFIELSRVFAATLRTVYAINKTKALYGINGLGCEQAIVAELDSAMNSWLDKIPSHLRWDPNREDEDFFNQSVTLYANYYLVQIIIHRPFIPAPNKPSPLSFPSLAICANAARSCSHLADIQRRRTNISCMIHMAIFTSCMLLLLNLWSRKRFGLSQEVVKKDMEDVFKCMQALKTVEVKFLSAGRLWDILYELANAGDLPLPEVLVTQNKKRPREASLPSSNTYRPNDSPLNEPRNIAGAGRVHQETSSQQIPVQNSPQRSSPSQHPSPASTSTSSVGSDAYLETSSIFSTSVASSQFENIPLPMYSHELGRHPLHGPSNCFVPQPTSQATLPSASPADQWFQTYPTFGDNGRSNTQPPVANYNAASFQQPPAASFGQFEDMSSLASACPCPIEPLMFPSGASMSSRPSTTAEGLQTPIEATPITVWDPYGNQSTAAFNNSGSIPTHLPDQISVDTGGVGDLDVDLMSWLSSPAGLLMGDFPYQFI